MRNTKELKQEQKGITLIALVITIVVLLILAGVSIAMLTGNNGILTQAKLAKENTQVAKEQEEKDLDKINSYINEKTLKDNYTDINGDTATIPEGFTVSSKEDEQTIEKGLVVYGPDGSEFVWVPVLDINSMSQCSIAGGSCNLQLEDGVLKCKTHDDNEDIVGKLYATELGEKFGTVNTTYNANEGIREPAYLKDTSNADGSTYNTIELTLPKMQEDYRNMATNVSKYGGFYVGRYETSLSDATASFAGRSGTVQSKPGVMPTSSENNATYRWYGLYSKQKEYAGKNGVVESSMIWGSQYDAMLNWAKNGKDKDKITNISRGNNSSGSVTTTGNSKYLNDNINNIRDLGGNLREWTLEAYDTNIRVPRGGYYSHVNSPSYRNDNYPGYAYSGHSSRLTLYIK